MTLKRRAETSADILEGGGLSESMDGRGRAILALDLVPKNLFSHENPNQKFFHSSDPIKITFLFHFGKISIVCISI